MTISGWKNRITPYILPCHWLYEWFSQFHRCGAYSVLWQSHSINNTRDSQEKPGQTEPRSVAFYDICPGNSYNRGVRTGPFYKLVMNSIVPESSLVMDKCCASLHWTSHSQFMIQRRTQIVADKHLNASSNVRNVTIASALTTNRFDNAPTLTQRQSP